MRTIDLQPNLTGHATPITHVAFRTDGKRLASCSYDGTVLIWDTSRPDRPRRLTQLGHRRLVNASAWNPADPFHTRNRLRGHPRWLPVCGH